jgi:hypothetical protein
LDISILIFILVLQRVPYYKIFSFLQAVSVCGAPAATPAVEIVSKCGCEDPHFDTSGSRPTLQLNDDQPNHDDLPSQPSKEDQQSPNDDQPNHDALPPQPSKVQQSPNDDLPPQPSKENQQSPNDDQPNHDYDDQPAIWLQKLLFS